MAFQLTWTIDETHHGMLLRTFLQKKISRASLTDIKFSGGTICVNEEEVTVRYVLKKGDILIVTFPVEQTTMCAENIPLQIVYEDDYVIVINKQPHIATIPSKEHPTRTIANALLYHYAVNHIQATVHIVTRLDCDTSGLLLVAKYRHVHSLFAEQQKNNHIQRRYEALCSGVVANDSGIIDAPIGRKEGSIIEREVRMDGQRAVTHYEVIKRHSTYTHISLILETGRTHQIRVHMAHLGHSLLGDDLYGGQRNLIERQALHSTELTFYHPFLERSLTVHVPLAEDMSLVNYTET